MKKKLLIISDASEAKDIREVMPTCTVIMIVFPAGHFCYIKLPPNKYLLVEGTNYPASVFDMQMEMVFDIIGVIRKEKDDAAQGKV